MAYKIDGVSIPKVFGHEITRNVVGDRSSSANGTDHLDVVAVKRTWKLKTRPITKVQRDAIIDYLDSILYGPVDFWCSDFGAEANTIEALVTVDRDERSQDIPNYWELELTVSEKQG